MYTLTICFSMWIGLCGSIVRADFPDLASCDAERKIQIATSKNMTYAICSYKKEATK